MIEPGSDDKKVLVKIFVLNYIKYFSRFPTCRATISIERKSSMFAFLEKTPFKSIPTWIYISWAGFHFHHTFAHNISCHLLKAIFSFGSGVIAFNLVCQCCSTWSILNYLMFNVNKTVRNMFLTVRRRIHLSIFVNVNQSALWIQIYLGMWI